MLNIDALLEPLQLPVPQKLAVAAAEDEVVLKAVSQAYKKKIALPILCGNQAKIQRLAMENAIDISPFEILDTASDMEAAKAAVRLVREKKADMLMKGLLQTADLLRAVLDKDQGLRGDGVLSHVSILQSPILRRMVMVTDAAMVTYPDLPTKVQLIQNAVQAAKGMGLSCPKVAPIAAVEVVNPAMQATVDAALLTMMNRRGQIKDCIVDGPLAMDLALSMDAVAHKNMESPVAGQADILLFHNIDSANSSVKVFTTAGNCLFGGVIMGAEAPIVLTSRSHSDESKLYSIACAASISHSSCR